MRKSHVEGVDWRPHMAGVESRGLTGPEGKGF
jgi:hypothetical protein